MKKLIPIVTIILIVSGLRAQNVIEPCYFDNYQRQHKTFIQEIEKIISQNTALNKKSMSGNVKIIPVVVHVIHNGGMENISDAQIQSQIDVLNEDYRRMIGTNGFGNGADCEVEFRLAKLTPSGECTNGIVRIRSALTNHQTYQRSQLGQLSFWDNTRYLNIYIVKNINNGNGAAAYSSFPGGPPDEDGIVSRYDYFGRTGIITSGTNGRTITHETGHWLGLYHTFNGGCGVDTCADGDYVCDTPPAANPNFGCPSINSCSNDVPDLNDLIQNYMDYSDDGCKSMFTTGQKARMMTTLNTFRTLISSPSNITSTGCDSGFVNGPCNVVADFTVNSTNICLGSEVLFTNKTLNNPTSFQWYFTGGTPVTSTALNPIVTYNTLGTFPVKLVAYGALGSDSIEMVNYITVVTPAVGQSLPYFEGFETSTFPPNDITIENPDSSITWERDTLAVQYEGNGSAKINNLININYGQSDAMILPAFDFTSFSGIPFLSFRWAYARSDANFSDELIVLASTDCGLNWTQKFYKADAQLVTGPTQTTPYIPDSSTVWKMANINLGTYSSKTNVLLKIVNVTDGGNNLYIDNINLGNSTIGIEEKEGEVFNMKIYPNPANELFSIAYTINQKENVSITITDVLGRNRYSKENIKQLAGMHTEQMNIELPNGVYNVALKAGKNTANKKVVIQK